MEEGDATSKIQAHQTERKQETGRSIRKQLKKTLEKGKGEPVSQLKNTLKEANGRTISRCTRSQVAPKWTKKETMILLNEIACQDYELAKALPSNQRWKIVTEGCAKMKINRSSNDCKRQWDSLLNERNKIRLWENSESSFKLGSYWSLPSSTKENFQLPASFDEDVFGAVEGVVEVQEALSGSIELVQVSDEAEKDDASDDADASDDNDASDDIDVSDDTDANDDSANNDDVNDESDSDFNDDDVSNDTESSDLNVPVVPTRAIKGRRKKVAAIFDTEATNTSPEPEAEAEPEAEDELKPGVDADAEARAGGANTSADLDADANANAAGAIKGREKNVAGICDTEFTDASPEARAGAAIESKAEAGADADADKNAVLDANANTGKKEKETTKVYSKEQEMANKLRENAKQIHAIIKGELSDDVQKIQIDFTKPNVTESEIIERQACELIKIFEVLVSNLDQFNNLIKEGSCEGINFIKPVGP